MEKRISVISRRIAGHVNMQLAEISVLTLLNACSGVERKVEINYDMSVVRNTIVVNL